MVTAEDKTNALLFRTAAVDGKMATCTKKKLWARDMQLQAEKK
jgi:hypothetical protein